jgi:Holliday junction resolvase
MAQTPEGKVKDAIKKFLKERGAWFFMPVSNGMGQVGIPDIIICYKGVFVAIETKAPGKKKNITANQERVIEAIRNADGFAWVVDNPDDMPMLFDVIDVYSKLEKSNAKVNPPQTGVPKVLQRSP